MKRSLYDRFKLLISPTGFALLACVIGRFNLKLMTPTELKTEYRAKAKELINTFYQPLGKLGCNVNSDTMWKHAKQRALEMCKIMLEEHSCYTLNDGRWAYWAQIEIEVNAL